MTVYGAASPSVGVNVNRPFVFTIKSPITLPDLRRRRTTLPFSPETDPPTVYDGIVPAEQVTDTFVTFVLEITPLPFETEHVTPAEVPLTRTL